MQYKSFKIRLEPNNRQKSLLEATVVQNAHNAGWFIVMTKITVVKRHK